MKKPIPPLLGLLLLLSVSWTLAAPSLSFTQIKNLYKEGEFEKIRINLESFLKQAGKSAQPKERIFAYKYLGVIYAAEPQGFALAETYFYQLLTLAPNAHLSDLYVSAYVEDVFARTQERFRKENRNNTEFDEFGNPRAGLQPEAAVKVDTGKMEPVTRPVPGKKTDPIAPESPQPKKEASMRVWPWVLGAGVAIAVGGYFWYAGGEKRKENRISTGP